MNELNDALGAERLAGIEARLAAAHPAPWRVVGADNWRLEGFPQVEMNTPGQHYFPVTDDATAQFVAHARTDIPALLAEVTRLRAALVAAAPTEER
jgi:hypothetical protein